MAVLALMVGLMLFESRPGLDQARFFWPSPAWRGGYHVWPGPAPGEIATAPSKPKELA